MIVLLTFFLLTIPFSLIYKGFSSAQNIYKTSQDFSRLISFHHHYSDIIGVTAYFPLNKSKHSHTAYAIWMKPFFSVQKGRLIVFTSKTGICLFHKIFNKQPNNKSNLNLDSIKNDNFSLYNSYIGIPSSYIIFNTTFSDPFEIPKLGNLSDVYERQHSIDREKSIHNKNLYAIWNGKISLIREVKMTYKSSYYYWIDIGSLREGNFYRNIEIPRPDLVTHLKQNNVIILFSIINPNISRNHIHNIVEGGFLVCSYEGVDLFFNEFWSIHDYRLANGEFTGKDQEIYNLMFFNSKLPISILPLFKAIRKCNEWFAFYSFLDKSNRCNVTFEIKPKEYYLERIGVYLLNA